jgi:type II secretory pathway pseudopilin PulG
MAALLVGLSIMAIMMTVAMPAWNQMARREKEAELVFRGEQYARAIGLFQRRQGPGALPPTIDVLVDQRFLRRKYKDPITDDDFVPLLLTTAPQQGPGQAAATAGRGSVAAGLRGSAFSAPPGVGAAGAAFGGITGVTSKSKEQSIRLYKGRNHYNEWQFVFTPPAQAPGAGGAGVGGQRGRQGQGPQGPGNQLPGVGGPGRNPGGRNPFPVPGNPNAPNNPFGPGRGPVSGPNQPPPTGR